MRAILLHQDDALLVFDKPAGLAVQGGSGVVESLETEAAAFAKASGKPPRLVHRLDRDTSGLVVMARTKPAAAHISAQFAGRSVEKTYLAITCGAPRPASGDITTPLKKDRKGGLDFVRVSRPGEPGALAAETFYETLDATDAAALVRLRPRTGRMHQLRAHLAAIGAPIAGDGKYGGLLALAGVPAPRLMLHAAALRFQAPDGRAMAFHAPPPQDMQGFAGAIGLKIEA